MYSQIRAADGRKGWTLRPRFSLASYYVVLMLLTIIITIDFVL